MNYQTLFEDNPNPCWIIDADTLRFLEINKATVDKYGYSREEFLSLTLEDIRPSEDVPFFKKEMTLLGNMDLYSNISRHKDKKGNIFYVRILLQPVAYGHKNARYVTVIDVDRRVKIEENTRILADLVLKQKQQLEHIFSSIKDVVWSCSAVDHRIEIINGACCEVFGYRPDELLGQTGMLFNNVYPEDIEKVSVAIEQLYRQGAVSFIFRTYSKTGALKHISHQCTVINDDSGKPLRIAGISSDITEQEVAKLRATQYASQVEELLESITDGFFAVDKNWRFTYINKRCEQLYAIDGTALAGQVFWDAFPAARQLDFHKYLMDAMRERKSVEFEEFTPSAGIWVFVKAYPTRDGLSVWLRDVTEQKILRDKLRREQSSIAALINNSTDIIWSIDNDNKLTSFNHAYASVIKSWCGLLPQVGIPTSAYAHNTEDAEKWAVYYDRALKGELFSIEEEFFYANEYHYLETRFFPIRDDDGSIVGVSCNSRDMTEFRSYLKLLEEQNKKLQEIAWIQSHKVRSPLASIMGLLLLYDRDNPGNPENAEIIDKTLLAANMLDEVIREVVKNTTMA